MEQTLIYILSAAVVGLGILVWLAFRRLPKQGTPGDSSLALLQNEMHAIKETLDRQMSASVGFMQQERTDSAKLIKEITQEITSVKEIGRETGKFAEQLKNLQDILKNPKQRGILGEYYLETVLKNVFTPADYEMQYRFKNGEIVDAVVFIKDKIVPIDSKFSLENYNRYIHAEGAERDALEKVFVNDLKLRIQETAKYIRPEENTMDFAFMFIPSEGIYYDLLTNQVGAGEEMSLIQRAAGKYHVIIVSPTSFLAYLQTVLQGLNALQIEENAKNIIRRVDELSKHLRTYEEYHQKLGNTLGTAVNHYNAAGKEFRKIDKDILRITGKEIGADPMAIEGPAAED